jgi:hypothetical protein
MTLPSGITLLRSLRERQAGVHIVNNFNTLIILCNSVDPAIYPQLRDQPPQMPKAKVMLNARDGLEADGSLPYLEQRRWFWDWGVLTSATSRTLPNFR